MTLGRMWELVEPILRAEIVAELELEAKREAELEPERAANREAVERLKKHTLALQAACDHQQGMDGEVLGSTFNTIQWHRYNTADGLGPFIGLCKKCGRQFLPTDWDYETYAQQRRRSTCSTAGVPFVPTAQELEERRAWEKTCREFRDSQAVLGLDEFDLPLEDRLRNMWVFKDKPVETIPDKDREAIDAILKET